MVAASDTPASHRTVKMTVSSRGNSVLAVQDLVLRSRKQDLLARLYRLQTIVGRVRLG